MESGPPGDRVSLPPPDADPATLLAVSGAAVMRHERPALSAVDDALAPDLALAVPPDESVVMPRAGPALDAPLLTPDGVTVAVEAVPERGVVVVVPPALDALPESPAALLDRHGPPASATGEWQACLVADRLSLVVDRHRRETRLDGVEAYAEDLPAAWLDDGVTHLSTALRPGYETTVAVPPGDGSDTDTSGDETGPSTRLRVHGVGESRASLGAGVRPDEESLVAVEVYPDGTVQTSAVDPGDYGLRSLRGVGVSRAEALRSAGLDTPGAVAAADRATVADIDAFDAASAGEVHARARAREEGRVVPLEDAAPPPGDPIFVDLETDGLSPSTAWLVGVLDGDAGDGDYLAFRQRDPRDRATHLGAFLDWLADQGDRPVVAYNGADFDFPVLRELIQEHCPDRLETWAATRRFDPYRFAVREGNAALPGRTDRLEDVARALGWTPATRGIDGETAARRYVAWETAVLDADNPARVPEPDWDRLEAYCEDDVRALATVHAAVRDAARREPATTAPTGEDSSQGSLSDFT